MGKNVQVIIGVFWNFLISTEGRAILLTLAAIGLKLGFNCTITSLRTKETVISLPGEITLLVIGFLMSAKMSVTNNSGIIQTIGLLAVIMLMVQYGLERYLDNSNRLSGRWKISTWFLVLTMYLISVVLYAVVVFGGFSDG